MPNSNYEPTEKEEVFLKYHDILRSALNNANWHFAVFKYLRNLTQDYLREFNIAPAFFGLTMRAHFFETVIRLNIFFDMGKDNISIYKFLNFTKQNRDIFSNQAFSRRIHGAVTYDRVMQQHIEIDRQLVKCDKQKLRKLAIRNLRQWRNKALAHINEEEALNQINIFRKYPLKPEQIDEIIDTLNEILNRYRVAYDAVYYSKDLHTESGIKEVVDSIRFRNQSEKGSGAIS